MKKNYRKLICLLAFAYLFFMTIGYSALSTNLNVDGVAVIKGQPVAVLAATSSNDTSAFRSSTYEKKIKTITLEDKINVPDDAVESWDVSASQDGRVMAYVVTNSADSTMYDLYIQGDGSLYANENSSCLFYYMSAVQEIKNLNVLNTSKVTDMSDMFNGMKNLTSLDLSNFDTSNVTDMSGMFSQMNSLTSLDLSNFDTSNVTNMSYMFVCLFGMSSLTSLDLSSFDTSNVTDMRYMFNRLSSLTSLDVSDFDTSKVTDMDSMFWDMSSLTSLDLSNFETSNVTNMNAMFGSMSKLTSLNVSNFNTSKVMNMYRMFY